MKKFEIDENKFDLLDNLPLGIFILREDLIVLFWNTILENWTGISRSEIVGAGLADHFPSLNEPKYTNRLRIVFEGGPPAIFSSLLHKHIIPSPLSDGQFRIQETTVTSIPSPDNTFFYALFAIQDVTDLTHRIQGYRTMRDHAREENTKRWKAEARLREYSLNLEKMVEERTSELKNALMNLQNTQSQLIQSEKMASIGQLAAGVAHEINNPVGFVKSNLGTIDEYREDLMKLQEQYGLLEETLENGKEISENRDIPGVLEKIQEVKDEIDVNFILDDYQKVINESLEGMERVIKIVADLKNLAHIDKGDIEHADINKGIESTLNIVRNELKYKAEVIKDLGDIPLVKCYPQRLNQVFTNILVNAAQSIEKKGEIRIATRADNGHVEIRISDTGCGIPPEALSKIYDPFFTTKEVGKGTGLGLNMAYNIIEKHQGTINVETEVGKGTTFIISLQKEPDLVE